MASIVMILTRCAVEVDEKDLFYGSIQGMTSTVPYASFYSPEEEDRFEENVSGEYIGLGVYCQLENGKQIVRRTIFGSPAADLLEPGDEILRVNQIPVAGLSEDEVYGLMRGIGEIGSICSLKIKMLSCNPDINQTVLNAAHIASKTS